MPKLVQGEDPVFIGIKVEQDLAAQIDQLAVKRSSNRSALIREAMRLILAQEQEGASVTA